MHTELICRGCKETKPSTDFPIRNDRSGRLRPYCKLCSNNIQRTRYHAYRQRDYFKWKCTKTKGRASQLNIEFNLTPEYLKDIWTECCPITGIKFDLEDRKSDNYPELDKYIPSKGYTQGNVTFISRRMNRIKSDVTWEELFKLQEWLKLKQN